MSALPGCPIGVDVNGQSRHATVEPRTSLADFLRDECALTGTHLGCEHGICGACTVIVDGDAMRSCLMLAVQANGSHVETVEALAGTGRLDPLQQAFAGEHGLQCGFCTPGILMSVTAARRNGLGVGEVEHDVLAGHVCRCTGYAGIRAAVRTAWESESSEMST
jgi:aerobic-type carbon monoxide dehydrogenase small subunit (CoxS/CutS family)